MSPWILPLFLVMPGVMIWLTVTHRELIEPEYLFVNNLLLLLWLCARLIRYAVRAKRGVRYDPALRGGRLAGRVDGVALAALCDGLEGAGYREGGPHGYREARDAGYWGIVIFHLSFAFVLAVGSYDYLTQFSASVMLGTGEPTPIMEKKRYIGFTQGMFFSLDPRYRLQLLEQERPRVSNQKGSAMVAMLDEDGRELTRGRLSPERNLEYGDIVISYNSFVYSIWLVIEKDDHIYLTDWAVMKWIPGAVEGYTMNGAVSNELSKMSADVWIDPATEDFVVSATLDGQPVVEKLHIDSSLPRLTAVESGFIVTVTGVGRWSDLQIKRKRHVAALKLGALIALAGLLVRAFVRPRRAWVVEDGQGADVYASRVSEVGEILGRVSDSARAMEARE
jgi:hypothetical protein